MYSNRAALNLNVGTFYKNWNFENENDFLLRYILQSEDLDDYKLIKDRIDFIENYDFKEITSKYEVNENFIIFIVLQDKENFKTFTKFNVNSIKSNFKLEYAKFNLDEKDKIKKLIQSMKIRYDDEWKKINLINSSIKLKIQLNLNSKNIKLIQKIEKILSEIELIEKYFVIFFDNEITRYSILSNSTPDILIKEFEKLNIKVSIENNIWTLNE